MFKKHYTQDYYDAVDILIRQQHYDSYVCVIFDIGYTISGMDIKFSEQMIKDLKLTDYDYNELANSDYVVIEFDKYIDMEQYLFQIEHQNVFAKFYKMGELFEELPEEE